MVRYFPSTPFLYSTHTRFPQFYQPTCKNMHTYVNIFAGCQKKDERAQEQIFLTK